MLKNEIDTQLYQKLIERAEKALIDYPHIEAADIVSEVVLESMEKEEFIPLPLLPKLVYHKALNVSRNRISGLTIKKTKRGVIDTKKFSKSETTKVCASCKQSLPMGAFHIVTRGGKDIYAIQEILVYCKECQVKKAAESKKKRKENGIYDYAQFKASKKAKEKKRRENPQKFKNINNAYQKKWQSNPENKEKWNAYVRERYRQKKILKKLQESGIILNQ